MRSPAEMGCRPRRIPIEQPYVSVAARHVEEAGALRSICIQARAAARHSNDSESFMSNLDRLHPRFGDTIPLPFDDDYATGL